MKELFVVFFGDVGGGGAGEFKVAAGFFFIVGDESGAGKGFVGEGEVKVTDIVGEADG